MKPILFEWHNFILYSYPLFLGLAWGMGYQVSRYFFSKYGPGLKGFNYLILNLFIYSWLGAKLFFIFFSAKSVDPMAHLSFWLGGGFVFYGGVIAAGIYLSSYCYKKKKSLSQHLALFIPALCYSHALGRVGCFLAGCCYGRETHSLLGVMVGETQRLPVQLVEAGSLVLLGSAAVWLLKQKKSYSKVIALYFVGYGLIRFLLEFLRADQIRGFGPWGPPSQVISLMAVIGGLIFGFTLLRKKNYEKNS